MSQAFPKTGRHAGVFEVTGEPGFPEDWRHAGVYEVTGEPGSLKDWAPCWSVRGYR